MTDTTDPTAAIEVWARMLCAADVHVYGEDHPTWQQLVGEPGSRVRDDYRKAAAWLLPRMTVAAASAVVPAADRAAVYREVADRLAADAETGDKEGFTRIYRRSAARKVREWAAESAVVDRVAAETPPAETLRPATTEWTFEACYDTDNDKWHGIGGTYRDHDEAKDAFKRRAENDSGHVKHFKFRMVRATTTYTVEAEHTPAVEAQPGNDTETPRTVCGRGTAEPEAQAWAGATDLASDREIAARAATGLVGYRQGNGSLLHCLAHKPAPASRWADFHEVTAEDLEDGGICVHPRCGRDLLARWTAAVPPAGGAQQPKEA